MRDYTDIIIILDESGSMQKIKEGTLEGLNSFIREQKEVPGEGCWTLYTFADYSRKIWEQKDQKEVQPLSWDEYRPYGGTALLDAVCRAVDETGTRLAKLPEYLKPDKVLLVIMTDGEENSSRFFSKFQMADRLKHQQEKYNWQVLFLGANQDAIATAAQYNIPSTKAFTYQATNKGALETYALVSRATRSWKLDGVNPDLNLIPEDMK